MVALGRFHLRNAAGNERADADILVWQCGDGAGEMQRIADIRALDLRKRDLSDGIRAAALVFVAPEALCVQPLGPKARSSSAVRVRNRLMRFTGSLL